MLIILSLKRPSINNVIQEGEGGFVRVCMTNNDEGCINKHDKGVEVKNAPKIA